MKKFLVVCILGSMTLFAAQTDSNLTLKKAELANYSIGFMGGTMGTGIFLRSYGDKSYLQVSGIVTYDIYDSPTYEEEEPYDVIRTEEVTNYAGYLGASYGYYLYKDDKKLYEWLGYAIKLVVGGSISKTNDGWYDYYKRLTLYGFDITGGVGLGVELFSPQEKGLMVEFSIDYGTSSMSLLGISTTGAVGFNF